MSSPHGQGHGKDRQFCRQAVIRDRRFEIPPIGQELPFDLGFQLGQSEIEPGAQGSCQTQDGNREETGEEARSAQSGSQRETQMSILIDKNTRVMTQGITGKTGMFHTKTGKEYANGANCYVAGVNPKKPGESYEGIPIFGTVREAKEQTGANVSVIYVPPPFAAAAIDEAVEADLDLVICITEGIPVRDMLLVRNRSDVELIERVGMEDWLDGGTLRTRSARGTARCGQSVG